MNKIGLLTIIVTLFTASCDDKDHTKVSNDLNVVIIRHGEKPEKGDNLSCQGFNRALELANMLHQKIGMPSEIIVPALDSDEVTKHSRMFQTISPFAIKYNLAINSKYSSKNNEKIAKHVLKQTGTVLMVWDHSSIQDLAEKLGATHATQWDDDDFDSIWLITFADGEAQLAQDKEGLNPTPVCNF
jgi:hypothetical protein